MSTKRTIINADEELVIKGKLTIEGNVTQIETTQEVTNLQGNVFTINSDGSNTSAVLALNSNGTTATVTFSDTNDSIVVNKPIIFTSGNVTAPIFVGNVIGNVTGFVSSISNFTTNSLSEGLNNLYYTVARANTAIQGYVSIVDAGGDGSLSLSANSSQLVITYTGPNQSDANTRIDARLSGGDGVDYASGVIAVDSTVVRTTSNQSIAGVKTFTGDILLNGANILPVTSNTGFVGTREFHIGEIWANVVHAEILDLGDADLSDIHATFYAGTPTGNIVSINTSTAGGLIYNHKQAGQANAGGYYRVNAGAGLTIDGNGILKIDNTVITTAGGQTINGNLTLTGNLSVVNIDSQTQTDSVVNDKVLYLNVGGGASPNNSRISVEKTAANVYLEYDSRWKFTNDGANVNNMLLFTDFSAGNGLSYDNVGGYAVVAGSGITTAGANVAVDSSVVRTTGDANIAGVKTFTGELVVPSITSATVDNSIFVNPSSNSCFIVINGNPVQLTADSDVGQVEDVGSTGTNIYAGFRQEPVDNVNIIYHGIRSIDGGTYTTASVASNVITIDGNITAIRGSLSTANVAGYGNLSYNSSNGVFSYSGVTDSQIRTLFSGSGLITYNSANGSITTSADNYGSWTVQTDSGVGAVKTISSSEKLTIQSGAGITVTNTGNVITITNDSVADIESVSAGDGLTGGGNSGNVTLNIGAGAGITVNADNVALTSGVITAAVQSGGISAVTVDTYGRVTNVIANAGYTTNTGTVTSVSGGSGLTGTVSTTGSLDVGAGPGITVNADNVAVNVAFVRGQFSATGDLSYNASTGVFSFTNDAGDIEGVTAGNGLTGGGTSGTVTLNIGAGAGITVNADNVALTSGVITAGTYGTASAVPAITVDTYGRATGISNTSISITASQVSNFTSAANTAIDNRIAGGSGLTYSSGTLSVGAGSYIQVGADDISVNASTTATASTIAARDASGNITANVFVGVSTSARYADLAENYLADADYLPGTVLIFGGDAEVTSSKTPTSTRIAGVVTTQPAHVMNSHLIGPNVVCIALRGRVPVKVKGVVRKGDVLVSAGEGFVGYAVAALYPHDVPAAAMVGKAIGDKLDAGPGVVEALI
jgi:hypothetical protein